MPIAMRRRSRRSFQILTGRGRRPRVSVSPLSPEDPEELKVALEEPSAYALLVAVYASGLGALLAYRRLTGKELPERVSWQDLALGGLASHKLARLVAKDKVATFVRRPFAHPSESAGPSELEERPRGRGVRRAVGELIVCPYCVDQWVATVYTGGLVAAPRLTRFLAATMTVVAISDFCQLAYRAAQQRA